MQKTKVTTYTYRQKICFTTSQYLVQSPMHALGQSSTIKSELSIHIGCILLLICTGITNF